MKMKSHLLGALVMLTSLSSYAQVSDGRSANSTEVCAKDPANGTAVIATEMGYNWLTSYGHKKSNIKPEVARDFIVKRYPLRKLVKSTLEGDVYKVVDLCAYTDDQLLKLAVDVCYSDMGSFDGVFPLPCAQGMKELLSKI